ncbi:hypothetical protein PORY_001525 [Pneumocystis oryctolagi]|uniref:Uncharacterized protein n=1 Tax=Pneumocystis oryctolagi TaxID=42067 RepID=A0ACB7CD90_9ASCO|nr:hypothetical protein PORY_001525 [Pneumocystis oryctolagi]
MSSIRSNFIFCNNNITTNTAQILKNIIPLFKKQNIYQYIIPYISIKSFLRNLLLEKGPAFCIFTFLPDELLYDIPEQKQHLYSLFQGFLVTFNKKNNTEKLQTYNYVDRKKVINNEPRGSNKNGSHTDSIDPETSKDYILNNINIINIQKTLMSCEIKEINKKITLLSNMKSELFDKLQKLEHQETETINILWNTEDEVINNVGFKPPRNSESMTDKRLHETKDAETAEFISKSIYSKLKSSKLNSKSNDLTYILHEQFKPGSNIKSWKSHSETITAIDFDMPFGTMVTASLDDKVKIWNLLSGEFQGLLEGHNASVKCLQLENNIVATGSMDASIKLWNLQHIDSNQASNSCRTSNYINKKTEKHNTSSFPINESKYIYISPFNTEKHTTDFHIATLESHMDEITALHFIKNILVSGSTDKTLRQWDLETGKCVQTLDILWTTAQCNSLPLSLNNFGSKMSFKRHEYDFVGAIQCFDKALASGTADGVVRLWDLRNGLIVKTLFGHTAPITCLQFDKYHLITGSIDRSIRIWDLRTGTLYDAFAYHNAVTSLQFDTKRVIVSASEPIIRIYDRIEEKHWDCGMIPGHNNSGNIVKRIRHKEGYLISGRQNGIINIYAC